MNRNESGVMHCGRVDGVDIVGEWLHYSVFVGSAGRTEHNLIARLEGRSLWKWTWWR